VLVSNPFIYFLNTNGVLLLVGLILVLLYINKRDREVFWHAVTVLVVTFVVVTLLKELFDVPRPFQATDTPPLAGLTQFPSFPSAHSAIAFSVSTIVALHRRRIGIFFLILSTLIAIGRVAAQVHYPIDVAFGMLIGVMIALFFDNMHQRTRKRKLHA
jgi:undecaprenyl-diphosphatase